jgi:cyclophilin family peptidyl-prolyl cis-trans isomerase
VSNMGATNVQYGRTITVTVNGTGLTATELSMRVDGPCVDIAKSAGGTELQLQFTCRINGLGSVVARIRNEDRLEYASLSLNVPNPQVSMSVRQGTRSGTYVVELDPVAAPVTVDNFLAYVNAIPSFYLNTIFHRVVADFVVQAGGFTTVPAVKPPTRAAIVSEANNGLKNLRGTIAMARQDGADTATSQFYLNLVDNPGLDFGSAENPTGYAVFGKVISGQEVVDEIGIVPVKLNPALGLTHQPVTNVVITGATQIR